LSDSLGFVSAVVVSEIVPGAIALYAAYWAFSVRKALAGRMYKRHAFFLGVLCVIVSMVGFLTYSTTPVINDLLTVFYSGVFIFLFAFIDSTVPLARRSDPLLRSVLRWDKLRIALWIDTGALVVMNAFSSAEYSGSTPGQVGFLLNILWFVFAAVLFGVSAAALVIGARRSRDPLFQRNLKWLGLVLIVVLLEFVYDTVSASLFPNLSQFDFYYSYYALPTGLLAIVASYFLYRSARSLAPISFLAESEPRSPKQVGSAQQERESPVPGTV
jgi:hypothetical protein